MSAAGAAPPPYPAGSGAGGHDNSRPGSSSSVSGAGERTFQHIQDLNRKALSGFNTHSSVQQLLQAAELALNQAQTLLDYRRQDLSYVEYLRAAEIVVEIIPHNKGWPDLQMDQHGGGMQKYMVLQKRIHAESERYTSIKEVIVNNNKRSGVLPVDSSGAAPTGTNSALQSNGNANKTITAAAKVRPTPSPKPDNMHGKAVLKGASGGDQIATDPLSERFARLRMNGNSEGTRPGFRSSDTSSVHGSPISRLGGNDYGGRASIDSLQKMPASTSGQRPLGPRPLPPPPIPGKVPLDTSVSVALPKEPSPTYSPARNMQTTENMTLPRHTPRSLAATSTRRLAGTPSSTASAKAPNGLNESGDYFPAVTRINSIPAGQHARRVSINVPKETRISTERLYDYIQRFNVLLIDLRPREMFDQGHIFARTVMCVDPIHLSQGMSADQLQDRMVIGPDIEQELFVNRDQFDLVVYYDANTQSESYLTRPMTEDEMKLKCLHDALDEFNHDKPLRNPPILLVGGVEAWVDLVGPQALASSNTVTTVKQGRPLQRRPAMVGGNSSQLRNAKRRVRDYNPLDDEEERSWRERARAESVVLPSPTGTTDGSSQALEGVEEGDEESTSAIRDFLERFPEAGSLERHAFAPLHPVRGAPEPPPKLPIPSYPVPSPATSYPSAPTRPPPAAARTSYTGVSDRSASHTTAGTRSAGLAPYIPPKYLATNLRLPKTGLYNFRYTCYMNATIQALSATTPLSIFFLDDQWRGLIQRENWKGTKGVLTEFYANLVRSLWKGDVNFLRPTTFRNFCGRLKSEWGRDDQQQDAKEFFDFLVDGLHEDLNMSWAKTPLKALTPAEEQRREKMPKSYVAKIEWGRFTHRDSSFITSLFGGQYSSRLQCLTCGQTSTTYDAFYSLSVEIPQFRHRNPTLQDCIKSYCSQETLKGGEQAKCERCKEFRDSTKQITITRAPQFLVVHFKRFHTFGRGAQKINTAIDFPLENFDLEPWMLKAPTAPEVETIVESYGTEAAKADSSMTPPYTYDAYAVIRHLGPTLEEGHYMALVKDRARKVWRCFDDRVATDFVPGQGDYKNRGDIRNGQAYIVFYQRTLSGQAGTGGATGKI